MNNISLSRISSWFGGLILIFTILYIIIFDTASFNPDYGSYEKLYNIITNQDFRFYLSKFAFLDYLIRILDFSGDYRSFRLLVGIIQLFLFFYVVKKLNINLKSLTLFISLGLSSFLLLKVHVQIRESIALLIWLVSLNNTHKERYVSFKNFALFFISTFLHTSTIIYWISTLILKNKIYSLKLKRKFITILFSIVGLSVWPFFEKIISLDYYVRLGYGEVEISTSKLIYWLSFFIIFYLIFKNENSKITPVNSRSLDYSNSSIIGNIGFYGFLGFAPIAAIGFFAGSPNELSFNLIFRMILNLLIIISFYRNSSQPKSFYTNLLNSFIFLIVFRLLFLPNIN